MRHEAVSGRPAHGAFCGSLDSSFLYGEDVHTLHRYTVQYEI